MDITGYVGDSIFDAEVTYYFDDHDAAVLAREIVNNTIYWDKEVPAPPDELREDVDSILIERAVEQLRGKSITIQIPNELIEEATDIVHEEIDHMMATYEKDARQHAHAVLVAAELMYSLDPAYFDWLLKVLTQRGLLMLLQGTHEASDTFWAGLREALNERLEIRPFPRPMNTQLTHSLTQ